MQVVDNGLMLKIGTADFAVADLWGWADFCQLMLCKRERSVRDACSGLSLDLMSPDRGVIIVEVASFRLVFRP